MAWRRTSSLAGYCLVDEIQKLNAKKAKKSKKQSRRSMHSWQKKSKDAYYDCDSEAQDFQKIFQNTLLLSDEEYLKNVDIEMLYEKIEKVSKQHISYTYLLFKP